MESNWPASLETVASSGIACQSIGHAVILRGHLPDFYAHQSSATSVSFTLSGTSAIEWKRGGYLSRFITTPGGFSVFVGGGDSAFYLPNPLETLNLAITPAQLHAIAERELGSSQSTVELYSVYQRTTPEIVALGQSFAGLLRSQRPSSGLYAETLWTQIAIQLLWNFSSLPRPSEIAVERLSDARVRRVIDYLQGSLAEEVSLGDLAELAGLSPNYLLGAFKKATGKTPHRYLTELRIAKACELLHNPQLSIVTVALAVGFSSQSHFTTVFGRYMKTTPASYRTEVLGLKPDPG
jgi:AraC family transcriptional regulator